MPNGPADPAPFEIQEGRTRVLDTSSINAIDEDGETPQAELEFSVTQVEGGFFANSTATTVPITDFSWEDVDQGRVVFNHDGSNVPPTYTLEVTDTNNGTTSKTYVANLIEENDAPEILVNKLTLTEGNTVELNSTLLLASDEESAADALTYEITDLLGGNFVVKGVATPLSVGDTFTQAQVNSGDVSFVHDGVTEDADYSLTLTDGGIDDGTGTFVDTLTVGPNDADVVFTAINDTVTFSINFPTVNEGAIIPLTSTEISATDEESGPSQLTYTVDAIANGAFLVNGEEKSTFTQADINAGTVVTFVHDGTENAPSFTLSLSDNGTPEANILTESVTPAFTLTNDPPTFTANQLNPVEGQLITLTAADLAATDREDAASELLFSIDPATVIDGEETVINGNKFFLNGVELTAKDTFSLVQINAGLITFQDDGDEFAPTYEVTVTDTDGATKTEAATINLDTFDVNDSPVLQVNTFDIDEGQLLILNDQVTNLFTTDAETTAPASLNYTISNVVGGEFLLNGSTPTTTFTQLQLDQTAIAFKHDGSSNTPSFTITVTDTDGGEVSESAVINFNDVNDAPIATADGGADFSTDAVTSLVTPDLTLNDTDEEQDPLTIASLNGTSVNTPGDSVTLTSGAIVSLGVGNSVNYDPNGQFAALALGQSFEDSFTYTVNDGAANSNEATVTVTVNGVNDSPLAIDDLSFTTDEVSSIVLNVLANDTDVDKDTLSIADFDASKVQGQVFDNGDGTLTYDPTGALDSLADGDTVDETFTYTVSDGNGGTATAQVTITVEGINTAPVAVADGGAGFSTDEDTPFTTANVLPNDTDIDGGPLSILSIDTSQTRGSVTNNNDGTFSYDPTGAFDRLQPGQTDQDTFAYTVSDGNGGTATSTVTIDISGLIEIPDSFLDLSRSLRYENLNAAVPTDTVDGLPLAELFDESYYLSQNLDVAIAVDAGLRPSGYQHFLTDGLSEGRNPSILFDEDYYLAQYPDVADGLNDPNGIFDSGLEHFLLTGHEEGRNPSPFFSQDDYLAANPDIAATLASDNSPIQSAFEHYILYGSDEERLPSLSLYNETFYLDNNPDVAAAVASGGWPDGFAHFVSFGQFEGRAPSSLYDEASYLALNPDVAEGVSAGVWASGFEHYFKAGRFEGRGVS